MTYQHPGGPPSGPHPGAPQPGPPDPFAPPGGAAPAFPPAPPSPAYPSQVAPGGYPPQPYAVSGAAPALVKPARPDEPRSYPQLLRGPKHRWWRPLVSIAAMLGLALVTMLLLVVVAVVVFLVTGASPDSFGTDDEMMQALADEPLFLLANNLLIAAGIPLGMLAIWIGHGWRPRWVASVAGGMRWRWLVVASAVALAVQLVATAVFFALDGVPSGVGTNVVWLLVVVFLTTPLQAAGEEYVFRGWLTQTIGSWIPAALVSALLTGALASTLFAMAHGSQNIWLFLDRFAFGVLASYLTWRTGGLEAAIGTHAINNIVVFIPTILTGGMAAALAVTDVPAWMVGADVAAMVVTGVVLVRLADRMGVQREYRPVLVPPGPLG